MADSLTIAIIGATLIATLTITALALLNGWRGWLDYKCLELGSSRATRPGIGPMGGRIELADLRERVRKLEAIAAGIEI